MAFMEWRRFNFFELNKNIDSGKINEALKGAKVTAATSGHGQLVFGDSEGNIHLVNRLFHVITIRAHEQKVSLAQQLQHTGLLVTVGEEEGGAAVLKVWDCERLDRQGLPMCVRVSRISPTTKNASVSALCVHEHQNLLALGFTDGTIVLLRGDITRERASKQTTLKDSSSGITGLAFRTTARVSYLFVASTNLVLYYNITVKDKEQKAHLDGLGCEKNCSVLSDSAPETHFMIGRNDAIYCYTPDGRGPCYAVEGRKHMMQWSRSYLVIVSQDSKTSSAESNTIKNETLTVLDLQNKFLVFCSPVKTGASAVLSEWGCFLVLTEDNTLLGLVEKDLHSKLAMLFKKNLYDVAIRIAKSQQYDAEGLADIFRQYGDHLYSKGDHAGAIEQYIKTISKLEPSYVIRKFLDSQLIEHLTTYLQALHKQGLAGEDHTTLLLNCYTKLNRTDKLKEFLMTKDRELDFDVDTAIRVCRQVSAEDALLLAKKHARHDWYLKIQLEDRQQYDEVLKYVAQLEFSEAETNMRKYGSLLLQHAAQKTTDFLKKLCTDFRPSNKPLIDQSELEGGGIPCVDRASPEDFIHLFLNNSEMLVQFLEYMIKVEPHSSTLVYNTLVEHYLRIWGTQEEEMRPEIEQKVLRLLQSPDANYDQAQTLILCQLHHFSPGILHLYQEAKMYQHMLRYHITQQDYDSLLACCRKFGTQDSSLWVQALWACSKDSTTPPRVLSEVLQVIERERLLPPLLVIDALASSASATLGDVRGYLLGVLKAEEELTKQEQALIDKYRSETNSIRQQIHALQTSNVIFRGNLCNACNQHLELPSVHFLCQHSFHQHCFQSCAESENECPVCLSNNKKILDIIKSQEQARTLHESFHSQLERAQDGFSLVADYFGRGVFNQLTVLTDVPRGQTTPQSSQSSSGPGAEARIRLGEGAATSIKYVESSPLPGGTNSSLRPSGATSLEAHSLRPSSARVSPTPQARSLAPATANIRKTPSPQPSNSIGSRYSPQLSNKNTSQVSSHRQSPQPASARRSPQPQNPFEEDNYDETKNPFADEEDASNPFAEEDDDYDKNLNPFES